MDFAISNWVYNTFGDSKVFAVLFKIITLLGEWWAVCLIVSALLIFKKTRKIGIYAGITCLVAFCLNDFVIKQLVQRLRPLTEHPEFSAICMNGGYDVPMDYSMASGHATVSMALCASVFMHSKKAGLLSLPYTVIVGVSRIALCVHYATDVLAGWILGTCVAILVFYLINFIKNLYLKRKGVNYEKINTGN